MNDGIIVPYIRASHLSDNIPLFALDYNDFRSHMCAIDTELETPKFGYRSARESFYTRAGPTGVCLVVRIRYL